MIAPQDFGELNDYDRASEYVARQHGENDPNIIAIYFFPDRDRNEIRLVESDPTTLPHQNDMAVFRFAPYSLTLVPFRLAVAVIRPEEVNNLTLPAEWNISWDQARQIWSRP